MAGEKPTGGRSRPRARTHGEDEVTDSLKRVDLNKPPSVAHPATLSPPVEQPKREGPVGGLLRRFSTRKYRHERSQPDVPPTPPTPAVAISSPAEPAPPPQAPATVPRKSFSIRRPRDRDTGSSSQLPANTANQPELLSPPGSTNSAARKLKALGRSTSVNSADFRRRLSRRGRSTENTGDREPPQTSGSDRSDLSTQQPRPSYDPGADDISSSPRRNQASRAKSLGHARRESIQARRAKREQGRESNVPEETDAELAESAAEAEEARSPDAVKPVFLKGLFSVSTTSSKPVSFIQNDLIRVLHELGITFQPIKGGFKCRHATSVDRGTPNMPTSPPSGGHRRKISFGGLIGGDREREREEFRETTRAPNTPKSRPRPSPANNSFTNTDESDDSDEREERRPRGGRALAAGETTTHVQSDLGELTPLVFEVLIVKVPLLQLHGLQFKKVDGGTWQYKSMAQRILENLRL
jgi:hypothetical protein